MNVPDDLVIPTAPPIPRDHHPNLILYVLLVVLVVASTVPTFLVAQLTQADNRKSAAVDHLTVVLDRQSVVLEKQGLALQRTACFNRLWNELFLSGPVAAVLTPGQQHILAELRALDATDTACKT